LNIATLDPKPQFNARAERFRGSVRIKPLCCSVDPATATRASVTFEAGARTAWHANPLGQTVIVTDGCGWVQHDGEPVEEVRSGDAVRFEPGEKHWLGAGATSAATFIVMQDALDGTTVQWMERVTDTQYRFQQN
jgi:quercetin dioxygenase-like cupin family protein